MQEQRIRRTLRDAIGSIRTAEGRVVVLIGAGCSKTAGIPLASDLIQEIKEKHPEDHQRAALRNQGDNYNAVMGELSLVNRRKLLGSHIEKARINWAHLALAQLLKHQKIERVLSVNFDNLLIQACGAAGFYPPVYDLAATDRYSDKWVVQQSLLYLNGQHSGFVTLNTDAELSKHKTKLEAVVQGTGTQPVWLVLGYSGEADPLLKVLAAQEVFEGDLYWLGYEPNPSASLLSSGLFADGKSAYYVGQQDADQALTQIAQKLDCFPPEILTKPLGHIAQVVERIDFSTGGDAAQTLRVELLKFLQKARGLEQSGEGQFDLERWNGQLEVALWFLAGQVTKVKNWYSNLVDPSEVQKKWGALAYCMLGNNAAAEALVLSVKDLQGARTLWSDASEGYAKALAINPNMYEVANNWGVALANEAEAICSQDLVEARALWKAACEKYAQALEIKKDYHEAANNWGIALAAEARALKEAGDLAGARGLWKAASEKFAQALEIKKDMHEAATNWGLALLLGAQVLDETQAQEKTMLYAQAQALLEKHAALSPAGRDAVAYNLACVYALQGKAEAAVQQLEIARQANGLPSHWREDPDLASLRTLPIYLAWVQAHFPPSDPGSSS